jgi:hypothetical protein
MRSSKLILSWFRASLAAPLLLALSPMWMSAHAQQEGQQSGQTKPSSPHPLLTPDEKVDNSTNQKPTTNQVGSASDARQAQFIADSQKLYQLAQELKVEVAKSNKNTLSIPATKKAEEIEKLAKSLKERMRKE